MSRKKGSAAGSIVNGEVQVAKSPAEFFAENQAIAVNYCWPCLYTRAGGTVCEIISLHALQLHRREHGHRCELLLASLAGPDGETVREHISLHVLKVHRRE